MTDEVYCLRQGDIVALRQRDIFTLRQMRYTDFVSAICMLPHTRYVDQGQRYGEYLLLNESIKEEQNAVWHVLLILNVGKANISRAKHISHLPMANI